MCVWKEHGFGPYGKRWDYWSMFIMVEFVLFLPAATKYQDKYIDLVPLISNCSMFVNIYSCFCFWDILEATLDACIIMVSLNNLLKWGICEIVGLRSRHALKIYWKNKSIVQINLLVCRLAWTAILYFLYPVPLIFILIYLTYFTYVDTFN